MWRSYEHRNPIISLIHAALAEPAAAAAATGQAEGLTVYESHSKVLTVLLAARRVRRY
jgi:hypothetical protein